MAVNKEHGGVATGERQEISGSNTPDDGTTLFTGHRARSNSVETDASSITFQSASPSVNYPQAPVNSPYAQSISSDSRLIHPQLNPFEADTILERFQHMNVAITPPSSTGEQSPAGKLQRRGMLNERHPLATELSKQPMKAGDKINIGTGRQLTNTLIPGHEGDKTPSKDPTVNNTSGITIFEHSTWETVAEEDVTKGLMRLAMLATDEHRMDNTSTVEEYYSRRLAQLIKNGEVKFDARYMD